MKATYEALCEYGYAGLTIARIADDFEKSKSLLYHHYDSKDELLLDFLSFMLEQFERAVPKGKSKPPEERVDTILETALALGDSQDGLEFVRTMTELRAQAAHDQRFRDHFTEHDRVFREALVEAIQDGIETGVFREVDAEQVAAFMFATLTGELNQIATTESTQKQAVRTEFVRYVTTMLKTD